MRFQPLLLLVLLLTALPAVPQNSSPTTSPMPGRTPSITGQDATPEEEADRAHREKEMAKKANEERQAKLKHDTDKLLQLSTELKEYVDKTNENVLSVDVIKKAEEIEKLAHSVKEKMKGQ